MRRIAITGTGIRALGFARAILGRADRCELVALHDVNPVRMAGFCQLLGCDVPRFGDLRQAVAATAPDTLIVCTPDHTHADLIEQAIALGLEVITEKPMAVDQDGIARILDAQRTARHPIRVAFNMRYMPVAARIKSLITQNTIGQVRSVSADWFVDRTHGTEYFRRWHAHMNQSGGLLVHKASHHFDLLNWFIDDEPAAVSAAGSLEVFGSAGTIRGPRCRDCQHAGVCWAAMPRDAFDQDRTEIDPSWTHLQKLYFDAEGEDGYIRDRCVFREDIDIHDTMSVLIRYRHGAQVTYSLTAYSPYQGFALTFNGTGGRIEVKSISPATRSADMPDVETIRVITGMTRRDVTQRVEDMAVDRSDHAGGDERMMAHLLGERDGEADPLGQVAGVVEGAYSALVGICANESIASARVVEIPRVAYARERAGAVVKSG